MDYKEMIKTMVEKELDAYEEYRAELKRGIAEKVFIGIMALLIGMVIGGILETM